LSWDRFRLNHRRNKTIPAPGDCLNEAWLLGVVSKDVPYFSDCSVDAVVGIEKNVLAPDSLCDLFAADDLTSLLYQEQEDVHRDALKFEHTIIAAKFVGLEIELEVLSEPDRGLKSDWPRNQVALPLNADEQKCLQFVWAKFSQGPCKPDCVQFYPQFRRLAQSSV
jgi:hypothetical protein